MKHKIWFTLSLVSLGWIFLTTLLYSFMSMIILFGSPDDKMSFQKFITGGMNTPFLGIMGFGCIFAVSIIASFILPLSMNLDKLDNLDKAISEYQELKIRLRNKINNIINQ